MGGSALVALGVSQCTRGLHPVRKIVGADAERAMRHASASLLGGEHAVADDVVLGLVARSKCSAYDCEFVALAEALGTLLVTEDKALLKAFPALCRSLSDAVQNGLKQS